MSESVYHQRGPGHPRWGRLPVAPLEAFIGPLTCDPDGPFAGTPESLRKAYWRARRFGRLTHDLADRLAVELLGMHPCQVWGDDWFDLDDPPAVAAPPFSERSIA